MIYIVVEECWPEGFTMIKAFSDKDKAEAHADKLNEACPHNFLDFSVDELPFEE